MVSVQNKLKNFFRPEVLALRGYTPGEQPRRASGVVKLNTNENPYPPSSPVRRALRQFDPRLLRLYPDPTAKGLRKRLARIYRWPEEGVLVSNGSDEILAMLFRAAVGRGKTVQCPDPTYSLYPVLCAERGGRLQEVPLDNQWRLDFSRLDSRARLTLFGYPNPPIGNLFPKKEILRFCRKAKGLVLIDEAYADFSSDSCLEVARHCPNVVVLRTVSKSYSLAGLRLGYAFCHPRVAAELSKVKDSYNLDRLALALGEAAFSPAGCRESAENIRRVVKERDRLTRELRKSAFRVEDSRANFIWVRCPGPRSAHEICACLKARGVLVRWFPYPRLRDGLRITVGDPLGNDRLLAELKRVTALRPNRGAAARSR